MAVAISPGATVILTKAQALTLHTDTSGEPVATGKGPVSLTWKRSAGESGPVDGLDITINVVEPAGEDVNMSTTGQIAGGTAALQPAGTNSVNVTVPAYFEVDVLVPNSLVTN